MSGFHFRKIGGPGGSGAVFDGVVHDHSLRGLGVNQADPLIVDDEGSGIATLRREIDDLRNSDTRETVIRDITVDNSGPTPRTASFQIPGGTWILSFALHCDITATDGLPDPSATFTLQIASLDPEAFVVHYNQSDARATLNYHRIIEIDADANFFVSAVVSVVSNPNTQDAGGARDSIALEATTASLIPTSGVPATPASEDVAGVIELATQAEVNAGVADGLAVTPATLGSRIATPARRGIVELATVAETNAGTDTVRAVTPAGLNNRLASFGRNIRTIGHENCPSIFEDYSDEIVYPPTEINRPVSVSDKRLFRFGDNHIVLGSVPITIHAERPANADADLRDGTGDRSYFSLDGIHRIYMFCRYAQSGNYESNVINLFRVAPGDDDLRLWSVNSSELVSYPSETGEIRGGTGLLPFPILDYDPSDIYYIETVSQPSSDLIYYFNAFIEIEKL